MEADAGRVPLACRCLATRTDGGWLIDAEAFLCPDRHKQGSFVADADAAKRRRVEEECDRAERDYLEQPR